MDRDSFQSPDPTGQETLELFANAERFNRWMFESIAPYCRGSVLEIGSGIGNMSKLLLEKSDLLALSDLKPSYCAILKRRFNTSSNLNGIYQIDLSLTDFEKHYSQLLGQFDTIVALNVIEHIEDDKLAIKNGASLLKKGGRLIMLVPAYQYLYNSLDKELGHFRRYTNRRAINLLKGEGMDIIHTKYFNSVGVFGWWWSGSVLKSKIISPGQLRIYNKLVPVFRLIDKLTGSIAGLSVIAVATKG